MSDSRWDDRAMTWLQDTLRPRNGSVRIEPLPRSSLATDGTTKWHVRDAKENIVAFAIASSEPDPLQTDRAVTKLRAARAVLSDAPRQVILEPLCNGQVDGRSVAAYPYYRPIEQSGGHGLLARHWLKPAVLRWLRAITAETASLASYQQVDEFFRTPLRTIFADEQLGKEVVEAACRALERIDDGLWQPRCVLIHNDFWCGNLLWTPRRSSGGFGFSVIDWGGSRLLGQGIYDLVSISRWLRLSPSAKQRELHWHCQTLGCAPQDAVGYLLAALGTIGRELGGTSYSRYQRLVTDCHAFLRAIPASSVAGRRNEEAVFESALGLRGHENQALRQVLDPPGGNQPHQSIG